MIKMMFLIIALAVNGGNMEKGIDALYTCQELRMETTRQAKELIGCLMYDEKEEARDCLEGIGTCLVEELTVIGRDFVR